MSGYLQRLMARGAGTDALIHPLSRLPYAAIAESEPLGDSGDLATAPRAWEQPQSAGRAKGPAAVEAPGPHHEDPATLAPVLSPPFIRTYGLGKGIASVPHKIPSMPVAQAVEAQTAVSQQPPLEGVEEYTVNEVSEPFRLMTPRTLANAVAPFNRPSVRTPQNQPGMSAASEVHVSIGRIEVTAVTAGPAPRRAAIPRKSAMSLDDYLARRQRGEP